MVRVRQRGEMQLEPDARPRRTSAVQDYAVDQVAFTWRARLRSGPIPPPSGRRSLYRRQGITPGPLAAGCCGSTASRAPTLRLRRHCCTWPSFPGSRTRCGTTAGWSGDKWITVRSRSRHESARSERWSGSSSTPPATSSPVAASAPGRTRKRVPVWRPWGVDSGPMRPSAASAFQVAARCAGSLLDGSFTYRACHDHPLETRWSPPSASNMCRRGRHQRVGGRSRPMRSLGEGLGAMSWLVEMRCASGSGLVRRRARNRRRTFGCVGSVVAAEGPSSSLLGESLAGQTSFASKAYCAASLGDDYLASVYDLGRWQGKIYFIAMEYVPGCRRTIDHLRGGSVHHLATYQARDSTCRGERAASIIHGIGALESEARERCIVNHRGRGNGHRPRNRLDLRLGSDGHLGVDPGHCPVRRPGIALGRPGDGRRWSAGHPIGVILDVVCWVAAPAFEAQSVVTLARQYVRQHPRPAGCCAA